MSRRVLFELRNMHASRAGYQLNKTCALSVINAIASCLGLQRILFSSTSPCTSSRTYFVNVSGSCILAMENLYNHYLQQLELLMKPEVLDALKAFFYGFPWSRVSNGVEDLRNTFGIYVVTILPHGG